MLKLHPCFLPAKSKKKKIVIREKGREKKPNADKHSDNALQNRVNEKIQKLNRCRIKVKINSASNIYLKSFH